MTLDVVTVGDSFVDIVVPIPRFLRGNEDSVLGSTTERHLGGSSNFLLTASRLGLKTGVMDCLGDDDLGKFYRDALSFEGVDVSRLLVKEDAPTSHCMVLLTRKGKHAYIAYPGASSLLTPDEVDEAYIRGSRALYSSGYALTNSPIRETALKVSKVASRGDIPIFFDPSPVISRIPREAIRAMISSSEYLLLNEREIRLITGKHDIKEAASQLLDSGPEAIVVKRGEEGCSVHTSSGIENVPGFRVCVMDTTGAGDAFNAAFVYGRLKGWTLRESAVLANAVGAIKVTKLGAGRQVPTRDEVSRFLEENGVGLRLG